MSNTESVQDHDEDLSFAVAVCRAPSGAWYVESVDTEFSTIDAAIQATRAFCGQNQGFAMVCVDDDYFVVVRPHDEDTTVLLSDACMAANDEYASSALQLTGGTLPELGNCDLADPCPSGEHGILADFGLPESTMQAICRDADMLPSAQLLCIAAELGFASEFAQATDLNID